MDKPFDKHAWVIEAMNAQERALLRYATRLLGDVDRARDVVQDTFMRMCKADPVRINDHLVEWLFTVCRNRAFEILRKNRPVRELDEDHLRHRPSPTPDPAAVASRSDAKAHILEMLHELPPNQEEVIRLKFQAGMTYKEISRITGHSVSNVGVLIHTGIKRLRKKMTDLDTSSQLNNSERQP